MKELGLNLNPNKSINFFSKCQKLRLKVPLKKGKIGHNIGWSIPREWLDFQFVLNGRIGYPLDIS